MTMRTATTALLAAALCFGVTPAGPSYPALAQSAPRASTPESVGFSSERLRRLDGRFEQAIAEQELAGAVTLLARHGKIVSLKTHGKRAEGQPMTRDTIFRLASMSKPITGVAMMILFEEGKFRLDEPVETNEGDGGLYFNGDMPRSGPQRAASVPSSSESHSRWTGENGLLGEDQFLLLVRLVDQIIPSDEHSPGAFAAGVPTALDRILGASPLADQENWITGLNAIDKLAVDTFGAQYLALPQASQLEVLRRLAANEFSATTTAELFFKQLKHATWDFYYRTEIGIHLDLQFIGNGFNKRLL